MDVFGYHKILDQHEHTNLIVAVVGEDEQFRQKRRIEDGDEDDGKDDSKDEDDGEDIRELQPPVINHCNNMTLQL